MYEIWFCLEIAMKIYQKNLIFQNIQCLGLPCTNCRIAMQLPCKIAQPRFCHGLILKIFFIIILPCQWQHCISLSQTTDIVHLSSHRCVEEAHQRDQRPNDRLITATFGAKGSCARGTMRHGKSPTYGRNLRILSI